MSRDCSLKLSNGIGFSGLSQRLSHFGAHGMREIKRKVDMESTWSGPPDATPQQLMIER